MIAIENVSKSYGGKLILENVTLHLSEKKTHALLGLSGSGKSTLLKMMIGLSWPDRGAVKIADELMNPANQRRLCRMIGYVPQYGGLFPHLTVEKNVTLVARTLKWPQDKMRQRLEELLDLVGLQKEMLSHYPSELSGGQIQRVSIMRAWFLRSPYLLLDEPLSALDPILRASLQEEMKAIFNKMKVTVVFVTHDVGEAAFFGHTVTLLRHGRVLQHGPFDEFLRQPADPFVTQFLNAQRSWEEHL